MSPIHTYESEAIKEFQEEFIDMLNLVETTLGISERESVKSFLKSALKGQREAISEMIRGSKNYYATEDGYRLGEELLSYIDDQ